MPQIDRQASFSGTKEVAPPLAIDLGRLQSFLAGRLPDWRGPLAYASSRAASRTPPTCWKRPLRRYVLRRKPPGKLLPSAHAVDREFRVISALHAQGFPVPEPVLYCDDDGSCRHGVLS